MSAIALIAGCAVVTFVIKAAGPVSLGGRPLPGWFSRVVTLLAPALLAALGAPHVFADGPYGRQDFTVSWYDHLLDGSFDVRARMVDLDPADARLIAIAPASRSAPRIGIGTRGRTPAIAAAMPAARSRSTSWLPSGNSRLGTSAWSRPISSPRSRGARSAATPATCSDRTRPWSSRSDAQAKAAITSGERRTVGTSPSAMVRPVRVLGT